MLLTSSITYSATPDEAFQAARKAYKDGDVATLDANLPLLDGHELLPYVEYWRLSMDIEQVWPNQIQTFLSNTDGMLVAERMRAKWLRELARRAQWTDFLAMSRQLSTWDTELTCYSLQARIALGETGALKEARDLWFTGRPQPESCLPLFESLFEENLLEADAVWARFRLALNSGNRSVAKAILKYVPAAERPSSQNINRAARRPQTYLKQLSMPLQNRGQTELALYALYKTGRSWPHVAVRKLAEIEDQLPDEDRSYAVGQIAMAAAWKHHPDAHDWFKKVDPRDLNDKQLEWRVRAALRSGDWGDIVGCVEAMSPGKRSTSRWRYWKARALQTTGQQFEANALLASLSNEFNFYGQLAAENLGNTMSFVPQTYRPDASDVAIIAQEPGLQRGMAFYRNSMRYEGALEWAWTVKDYDDRQLLAAAALASRNEWYERAIHTAERTRILHDFSLRFPAPYRDVMRLYTDELELDEAWVYGLIRQESRFVTTARSTAGAGGLMQLMPSTAKWMAKRLGLKGHHSKLVNRVDTNISMGTSYLRQVMDTLDNHPVLASAGYNAGPRRAARWRDVKPLAGDVYAETIPFPETRGYVKKVMSNTMYYARLFGQTNLSLRDRLGTVPPRPVDTN
ncbi:MAG: transglycosylase SLT domain-containing protein [Betaproteobacteria bacterium]|nr:MAG: transglycosylase SLT domain-containing protein [Betaproteobacteria bacterium]